MSRRTHPWSAGLILILCSAASAQYTITEYPVLSGGFPVEIVKGPDGALWFTENFNDRIGRIDATTKIVTEYTVPGNFPEEIALGPDGALWFTAQAGNWIGRITTAGVITTTSVPTASSQPTGIAAGPDNAMWFTEQSGNQIGRLALPSTGTSPQLTSVSPNMAVVASGSPFTLTVNGSAFVAGASIQWTAPGGGQPPR
jgi:virginiamycin B lyase